MLKDPIRDRLKTRQINGVISKPNKEGDRGVLYPRPVFFYDIIY